MRRLLFFVLSLLLFNNGFAQSEVNKVEQEAAYTKVITARAQKIVTALALTDSVKAAMITTVLTEHYRNLNAIQNGREAQIKEIKTNGASKEETEATLRKVQDEAAEKTTKLHAAFLTKLSSQLTAGQVAKVKDGLTYNVLPITYKAYLDMIPSLRPTEKDQIMAWLIEAREFAMDAESSDKKHWWFGKYKGRINNYLAAQGYDLQKERKDWGERTKAKEEQKKTAQAL